MQSEYYRQSGWMVRLSDKRLPDSREDIISEFEGLATWPLDNLEATEDEALRIAREFYEGQQQQALIDYQASFSHYTSPRGITYICTPEFYEKERQEAAYRLKIAERGLALCQ